MKSRKKVKSVDKKYIIREVKENEFYCKSSRSIKYPWNLKSSRNFIWFRKSKKKRIQAFDISCFIGKYYFDDEGSKNDWIFQQVSKYSKVSIFLAVLLTKFLNGNLKCCQKTCHNPSWYPRQLFCSKMFLYS